MPSTFFAVLFGLAAMVLWGVSDYLATVLVKAEDDFKVLFYSQLAGLFLIWAYSFRLIQFNLTRLQWELLLISALLYTLGYWSLMRGFRLGDLSVVSPVSAGCTAISSVLGIVFLAETLNAPSVAGIALTITGVLMISMREKLNLKIKSKNMSSAAKYALIAMTCYGFWLASIKVLDVSMNPLGVVAFSRFLGMILLISAAIFLPVRQQLRSMNVKLSASLILLGGIDVVSILCVNFGLALGNVTLVSPLVTSYPIISVLLAVLFLRERPNRFQKIGIGSVIAGIVLLSLAS